jgi:integrase
VPVLFCFFVTWRDETGVVRKRSTGCKDESAARKVLRELERDFALDKRDPFSKWRKIPLLQHAEQYREFQLAKGTSTKQAEQVFSRVTRVLKASGIKGTQTLSVSLVIKTINAMRKKPQSPKRKEESYKPISCRTKNFYAKALKQLTAWMHREGRIEIDPLLQLPLWNVQVDIRHARRALTDDEFSRLEDAASKSSKSIEGMTGPERAFLYRMARTTGLRKSELGSLQIGSFFLDEPSHVVIEATNSKHRERDVVYLHTELVVEIRKQIESLTPGDFLFPLLAQRKAADMMQADLKAAGIAYQDDQGRFADFHALRHTFVTKAWETGAASNIVMNMARHKDISTTLKYTHRDETAQIKAIQAMPPPKRIADDREGS